MPRTRQSEAILSYDGIPLPCAQSPKVAPSGATHPRLVSFLKEWVFARDLLYEGTEPETVTRGRRNAYTGVNRNTKTQPRRWLLMKKDASGEYRPLESGEPTQQFRLYTGAAHTIADCRHIFITVLQGTLHGMLDQDVRKQLEEDLKAAMAGGAMPTWAMSDTAFSMGNTLKMWSEHYDAGEVPRNVETVDAILRAAHTQLLRIAAKADPTWRPPQSEVEVIEIDSDAGSIEATSDPEDWEVSDGEGA
jgi:hypothetical protein